MAEITKEQEKRQTYYVRNDDLLREIEKYKASFKTDENGKLIRYWKNVKWIRSYDYENSKSELHADLIFPDTHI